MNWSSFLQLYHALTLPNSPSASFIKTTVALRAFFWALLWSMQQQSRKTRSLERQGFPKRTKHDTQLICNMQLICSWYAHCTWNCIQKLVISYKILNESQLKIYEDLWRSKTHYCATREALERRSNCQRLGSRCWRPELLDAPKARDPKKRSHRQTELPKYLGIYRYVMYIQKSRLVTACCRYDMTYIRHCM